MEWGGVSFDGLVEEIVEGEGLGERFLLGKRGGNKGKEGEKLKGIDDGKIFDWG